MTGLCKWTRICAVLVVLLPAPVPAQEGADTALATMLVTHDVIYGEIAWERHEPNGRLLLRSAEGTYGRTSVGEWRIADGARCLRWTRAMPWACYTVEINDAGRIRFTDPQGNVSIGRLVPRRSQ